MSYPNAYLRDFVPVLGQILKEKQIAPEKLHLEIIDEESEEKRIFEPVGVDEVLDQLADQLNHLTVYTDRPAHFQAFAEQIYEENGLMPLIFTKKQLKIPPRRRERLRCTGTAAPAYSAPPAGQCPAAGCCPRSFPASRCAPSGS